MEITINITNPVRLVSGQFRTDLINISLTRPYEKLLLKITGRDYFR